MNLKASRESLVSLLEAVVVRRFVFYGYHLYPLQLNPPMWAVEVERVRPPAPAMGTVVELADVLEKYMASFGFRVIEVVDVTREGFAIAVDEIGYAGSSRSAETK